MILGDLGPEIKGGIFLKNKMRQVTLFWDVVVPLFQIVDLSTRGTSVVFHWNTVRDRSLTFLIPGGILDGDGRRDEKM